MDTVPPAPNGQRDNAICAADHVSAFKFLDFVFDGLNNSFIEFRYFSSGRKSKVMGQPTFLSLPLEHERISEEILNRNGQRTITVGLAPRCRVQANGRAGRNQDVLQVNCIWANLDNARAQNGIIDIIKRVRDFPLRPSLVVNSGYGCHVYFIFHTPLRAGEMLVWSELVQGLRTALGVDTGANLNEVMRLPGTLNIKEVHPVACEISEEDSSWARYSVEEVRKAIQESAYQAPSTSLLLSNEVLQQRGLSDE